jgi:hypothetical protein
MIDYDKLRLAHELAHKNARLSGRLCCVTVCFCGGVNFRLVYQTETHTHDSHFNDLDSLISKLTELTQPKCKCGNPLDLERTVCNECIERAVKSIKQKPKYEIGSLVWLIDCDEICTANIDKYDDGDCKLINCVTFKSCHATGIDWTSENKLYSSREALIESQIEYWQTLQDFPSLRKFTCPKCKDPWSKCECKEECEHESDDIIYSKDDFGGFHATLYKNADPLLLPASFVFFYRCIKCGEFYR